MFSVRYKMQRHSQEHTYIEDEIESKLLDRVPN